MKTFSIDYIFIVTLCLLSLNGYAQFDNSGPKDLTVHSPNVTGLGTYGEYPVGLSTGVPRVEVPLYTVKAGRIEIPLSLSYHASGIKVDQEASPVGLAWTLNAGGVITRTVRDKTDDGDNNGFLYTGKDVPVYNSIYNVNGAGGITYSDFLDQQFRLVDKEPDVFTINAPGLQSEFCLDNRGKFVSTHMDSLGLDIDLIHNILIVKDKKGNIYRFGKSLDNTAAYETSQLTTYTSLAPGNRNSQLPYSSSWFLTEMISSDLKDTVSFKYKTSAYSDFSNPISTIRYIINDGNTGPVDKAENVFDGIYYVNADKTILNVQELDKILFKGNSVQFFTQNDRIDIVGFGDMGKTRMTGLKVYDNSGQMVREIQFDNNNYFSRSAPMQPIGGRTLQSSKFKSLKLNAVKFLDSNSSLINAYNFFYDNTPLPPRNTTAQDFWGYYNGKLNQTLVPETFYFDYHLQPTFYGDNRQSDYNFMKAGSLQHISLPTGGYTQFEYEPNYYINDQQAQNKELQTKSVTIDAVNRLESCRPNYLPGVPANNSLEVSVSEELGSQVGKISITFSDFQFSNGLSMTFDLYDNGANIMHLQRQPSTSTDVVTYNNNFSIVAGHTYRMEAKTNYATGSKVSLCNSPFIQATLSYQYWQETTNDQIIPEQAGGLRIKTISNFNPDGSLLTRKSYEYGNVKYGENQVGVGTLITDPSKTFYNYPLLYEDGSSQKSLKNILWFTSDSQVELGLNHGSPIYYKKVTEKVTSSDNSVSNGKTEYYFKRNDGLHDPKSSAKYPYDSFVYPSWMENNMEKKIDYLSTVDGSYKPVKKIEYEYLTLPENRIRTLKIIDYQPDYYFASSNGGGWIYLDKNPKRFYYYNFFQSRGKQLEYKEIVTDYPDGVDSTKTEKVLSYNAFLDLNKEQVTNSKSQYIETNYKYTGDIAGYGNLVNGNMVSLPVQTEKIINNKVTAGSIFKYNALGQMSEEWRAKNGSSTTSYTSATATPAYYISKSNYEYDSDQGNLKTLTITNALPVVYIWSYNGEYPVAQIKGVSYSAIESALGGAAALTGFRQKYPTDAIVKSFLEPLRTSPPLKGAQVTTYTYKPLMGMTSMTDAKGETTYYEYDAFQRLMNVKDREGNILKHADYHYAGQ